MPAPSNAAVEAPSPSLPAKDLASARHVAAVIQASLREGRRVEIERLGEFRPVCGGGFRFVPENRPCVFLAYVSEDAAKVERLSEILEAAGFDAWMDRLKLLPGQNWPRAIERAIENADFFVACLSRHAVNKRSCFQGGDALRSGLRPANAVRSGLLCACPAGKLLRSATHRAATPVRGSVSGLRRFGQAADLLRPFGNAPAAHAMRSLAPDGLNSP